LQDKLPTEISLQDLLKSIEGQELVDGEIKFSFDNPVLSFIQAFNITIGKEKISDAVLHELYRIWNKSTVVDKRTFNLQFGKYIPSVQINRRYYFVNSNVLKIATQLEELKEKRRTRNRSKSIKWHKHFEAFLEETGIKPGTVYVESDILHYVYNNWCDDTRKKSWLGRESFDDICKLNFEYKTLTRNKMLWFGVNSKIKQLITKEEVERWREGRITYGKTKNSKEKAYFKVPEKEETETLYKKKTKNKKRSSKI
jgi:hypothetical protein